MKKLIPFILAALMLAGCADGVNTTNQLIADSNANNKKAAADALVACKDDAACKVGVMAIFFSNTGQPFYKPDTVVDYLRAGIPYADLSARIFNSWWNSGGVSGDRTGGTVVIGDNNQLSGFGNRLTADRNSSVFGSFESTSSVERSQSWENMYNPTTDNSRDQIK